MTTLLIALFRQYRTLFITVFLTGAALWGGHRVYMAGQNRANAEWMQKWAQRDASDRVAQERQAGMVLEEAQRRWQVAEKEHRYAAEELAKVRADAVSAERAGRRLRTQLAALQRQLASSETDRLSTVAPAGQNQCEAGVLLARLLRRSDEMAGRYAEEADRAYAAASSCERFYTEVTGKTVRSGAPEKHGPERGMGSLTVSSDDERLLRASPENPHGHRTVRR